MIRHLLTAVLLGGATAAVLGAAYAVASVGKERKPLTRQDAIFIAVVFTAFAAVLVIAGLDL